MKCSLDISNFLKRSLVFPILPFPSISLHCSLKKTFFSLLAILWNSAFSWVVYLSLSPLPFLLFPDLCKACSDNHFSPCILFSLGWFWALPPVQCYKPPSIYSSSGSLPTRSTPPNLFVTSTVYRSYLKGLVFFYILQFKPEFCNKELMV